VKSKILKREDQNVDTVIHDYITLQCVTLALKMLNGIHHYGSLLGAKRRLILAKAPRDEVDRPHKSPMR